MSSQLKKLAAGAVLAFAATMPAHATEATGIQSIKMVLSMDTMKRMDINKDGMVSRTEFMNYMGGYFDRMDKQKKGMVQIDSLLKMISDGSSAP